MAKILLKLGANIYQQDKVLHWAALNGHLDALKYFITHGAEGESTALHFAAKQGHAAEVAYLLSQGVNINARDPDVYIIYILKTHPCI